MNFKGTEGLASSIIYKYADRLVHELEQKWAQEVGNYVTR